MVAAMCGRIFILICHRVEGKAESFILLVCLDIVLYFHYHKVRVFVKKKPLIPIKDKKHFYQTWHLCFIICKA